jgi:hypothetical protein
VIQLASKFMLLSLVGAKGFGELFLCLGFFVGFGSCDKKCLLVLREMEICDFMLW